MGKGLYGNLMKLQLLSAVINKRTCHSKKSYIDFRVKAETVCLSIRQSRHPNQLAPRSKDVVASFDLDSSNLHSFLYIHSFRHPILLHLPKRRILAQFLWLVVGPDHIRVVNMCQGGSQLVTVRVQVLLDVDGRQSGALGHVFAAGRIIVA